LRLIRDGNYAFTFQTQSIFDASCPGTPHFVYTDHTLLVNRRNADPRFRYLYTPLWRELEQSIYDNASHVFVMSRHVAQSLIDDYGLDVSRVACVYAGCNAAIPMHTAAKVERYEQKRILFVGSDWKRKGGPLLVEAFKRVRREHPDATLMVVGCNPKVRMAGCTVAGKLPLRDMPRYFTEASLFCLPALREPFGIVYVEALRSGLPIIAFNSGAASDLVRESQTGSLVRYGDVDGLAAALCDLLAHPCFCLSLAKQGMELAHHRYNWPAVGRCITDHIRAFLNNEEKILWPITN